MGYVVESVSSWLDRQTDEVLRSIAAAEDWNVADESGALRGSDAGTCIIGHGLDAFDNSKDAWGFVVLSMETGVHRSFDRLGRRFGPERAGKAISERASRLLRERRMEAWRNRPKRVSEQEASVYFRTHVSLNCEQVEVGA